MSIFSVVLLGLVIALSLLCWKLFVADPKQHLSAEIVRSEVEKHAKQLLPELVKENEFKLKEIEMRQNAIAANKEVMLALVAKWDGKIPQGVTSFTFPDIKA